jgi:hypothetical protein
VYTGVILTLALACETRRKSTKRESQGGTASE